MPPLGLGASNQVLERFTRSKQEEPEAEGSKVARRRGSPSRQLWATSDDELIVGRRCVR